jgi:hypothetical protein
MAEIVIAELGHDLAGAVCLSHDPAGGVVEVPRDELAVDLPADATPVAVHEVRDRLTVREGDGAETTEVVELERRLTSSAGSSCQVAVGGP